MKLRTKQTLEIMNRFNKPITKVLMIDMYVSTNPANTFIAITPLYDEQGKRVKNTCKILHRELGELIIKGNINTLGKSLIENMEEKNNFIIKGYGKS